MVQSLTHTFCHDHIFSYVILNGVTPMLTDLESKSSGFLYPDLTSNQCLSIVSMPTASSTSSAEFLRTRRPTESE